MAFFKRIISDFKDSISDIIDEYNLDLPDTSFNDSTDSASGQKYQSQYSKEASPTPPPPIPQVSRDNAQSSLDNLLSPRLNSLVTAAVADGVITDMERQVLIRNAQKEGVDMDEFVMILEARLFEQRRALASEDEAKRNSAMTIQAQQTTNDKQGNQSEIPSPRHRNRQTATKCIHCGAPIKALASQCPECGYDYIHNLPAMTTWDQLADKIRSIREMDLVDEDGDEDYERKTDMMCTAICNCRVPNDKQELVDFMVACAPLGKPSGFFNSKSWDEEKLEKAYFAKAQQVLLKARIVLRDDPKLLAEIETIAKQYKIKK